MGDSGRMAVFTDPEGAAFCVWQAKEHKGARIVNEHGSLNFNGLNTRDPEGRKVFYGAVFGWRTLGLPGGFQMGRPPAMATTWRRSTGHPQTGRGRWRPGGLRGRGRLDRPDRGRPAGRAAALGRTFAVDDADAIAEGGRAGRQGGRLADGRALAADDGHRRPARRHLHREQVRPREPRPGDPGGYDERLPAARPARLRSHGPG